MTASDDDDTLLAAVAGGDRLALRKLYTTYHGRLFRFLMRVTHDAQLAEEILNDTLWIVWRGASGFRGQSRVSTWIMGIAYRRALKALSTLKRQDRLSGTSLDSAEGGDFAEVSVESVAQSIETEDWIDSAL
jgi:RNA polymerase sigma-70 factor (ECF subfamily)